MGAEDKVITYDEFENHIRVHITQDQKENCRDVFATYARVSCRSMCLAFVVSAASLTHAACPDHQL